MTPLLEVEGVSKDFEGFLAVDQVSLTVPPGEVRAIIGPNGAGKSTLFYLITGHYRPTRGRIRFAGHEVTRMSVPRIVRLGLVCTFQASNVFERLSALECVEAAVISARRGALTMWRPVDRATRNEARSLLELVGLTGLEEVRADALSHGDKRSLEIAMALASRPRLLLLDEPTAGMSVAETQATVALVQRLVADRALTVILVEHDMDVVFTLADRVTVMHLGQVLAEGTPAEVRQNPDVVSVYLGTPR